MHFSNMKFRWLFTHGSNLKHADTTQISDFPIAFPGGLVTTESVHGTVGRPGGRGSRAVLDGAEIRNGFFEERLVEA